MAGHVQSLLLLILAVIKTILRVRDSMYVLKHASNQSITPGPHIFGIVPSPSTIKIKMDGYVTAGTSASVF